METQTMRPTNTEMRLNPFPTLLALWLAAAGAAPAAVRYVNVNCTNPVPPFLTWSTAATNIQDAVDAAVAGDEVAVTNGIYASGGNFANGASARVVVSKRLILHSVNGPQLTVIQALGRCVVLERGASLSGFTLTNGTTPRGLLFDGQGNPINPERYSGGGVFCSDATAIVSNCVLVGNSAEFAGGGAFGGTLIHCTFTNNSAGWGGGAAGRPRLTFSDGRFVQSPGCRLINCTLSSNYARDSGGGAYGLDSRTGCTLTQCILTNNSAGLDGSAARNCTLSGCALTGNSPNFVGSAARSCTLDGCTLNRNRREGARNCTLNNCILTGNDIGAYGSTLNNCTLRGNATGASASTLSNCILYDNGWNDHTGSFLSFCCTRFMPLSGMGNITAAPRFINPTGGDLRLAAGSPCIDAGNNTYLTASADLDGRPRIIGGTVDIGAYEFQKPFNDWLEQNALATDGSADFTDADGDGLNSWQEWLAGTAPTDAASVVRLTGVSRNESGVTVSWLAVSNGLYYLERATNVGTAVSFSLVADNLSALPGTTSYTDTTATGPGPYFYRIGVQTEPRPFAYITNDGTITITYYTGLGGAEVIPATIHGLPVTRIGNYAFYRKARLTSLALPDGLTHIGVAAFFNCDRLTNVTISPGVIAIGDYAFASCYQLTRADIPDSVTSLGDHAFQSCFNLQSITIPTRLATIGPATFVGTGLTNVTIPDGITSIGDSAFAACQNLAEITLPNSVLRLGEAVFANCSALRGITVPDSVHTWGAFAFHSCTSLTNVTIGHGVPTISYGAFSNCLSLASVAIPDNVIDIGEYAFSRCTNLASVTLGQHVERIGGYAFYWCGSLGSLTVPDSVTALGDWAFFNCPSLTNASLGNGLTSIGSNAFANCTGLATALLGSSLTSIGAGAFNSTGLRNIIIPSTVTNIGNGAFSGCRILAAITVDALNAAYSSMDGVLFDQAGAILIQCPGGKTGSYAIPNGVLDLGQSSFTSCNSLLSVVVPNSVTNIGAWSFSYCNSLTNITIGSGVRSIGDGAFYFSYNLAGAYFLGDAPALGGPYVFSQPFGTLATIVYYRLGTQGWGPTYGGRQTALW